MLYIQATLLLFYIALAIGFSLSRKTWPLAIYYIGCVIKDGGVLALAYLSSK